MTSPNTTWKPSSHEVATVVMKKWDPSALRLELAIDKSCFVVKGSSANHKSTVLQSRHRRDVNLNHETNQTFRKNSPKRHSAHLFFYHPMNRTPNALEGGAFLSSTQKTYAWFQPTENQMSTQYKNTHGSSERLLGRYHSKGRNSKGRRRPDQPPCHRWRCRNKSSVNPISNTFGNRAETQITSTANLSETRHYVRLFALSRAVLYSDDIGNGVERLKPKRGLCDGLMAHYLRLHTAFAPRRTATLHSGRR